jgi:hypothetical protein
MRRKSGIAGDENEVEGDGLEVGFHSFEVVG